MEPNMLNRAEVEAQLEAAKKSVRDLGEQHRDLLAKGTDGDWADSKDAQEGARLLQDRSEAILERNRLSATLDEMPVPRPVSTGRFNFDDLAPFERFCATGHKHLTSEEIKDHCSDFKGPVNDSAKGFVMDLGDIGRMRAATEPGGAVSPTNVPGLVNRLKHFGAVSRVVRQFMTPYGTELKVTNLDDANSEGETIAKDGTATGLDLPNPTSANFDQFRCTSKYMDVHRYTIRDIQGFSMAAEVERAAYRRIGRAVERQVVLGTGASLPRGIVPAAGNDMETAAANAITSKEMTDLPFEVDWAYRAPGAEGLYGYLGDPNMGMRGFLWSVGVLKMMVGLEDTQKRPLYLPSIRDGYPDTYNGEPIELSAHLAAPTAAGNKVAVYGNLSYYGFRMIDRMEFLNFFDSGTALADEIRFLANFWYDAIPVGALTDQARATMASEAWATLTMKT